MAPPTIDDIVLLEMTIRGRVVVPQNVVEYERSIKKMHNVGFHDRKPALIVHCRDTEDVQMTLAFARSHELPVSVRSTGHSVCGSSLKEGTVVIDVGDINHLNYDSDTQEVTLGPGVTLSDINVYLMRKGRVTPNGVVPTTGCGGLCLHGGIGWLTHKYGLSADNITKMNLILADGTVKNLDFESQGEDKELFYAARGFAGSLGICTSFTLRTFPMEMLTGGFWMMLDDEKYTETRKLFKMMRGIFLEQEASGKRTLLGGVYMMNIPPEAFIPEQHHGKPCSGVWLGAWGTDDTAKKLVEQFVDREIVFGKPPAPMPFTIFNQIMSGPFLAFPPFAAYWKGAFTASLPDEKIDAFADLWSTHEPWLNASIAGIDNLGGKAGVEHAKTILGDNDHSVSGLRNTLWSFPLLMYFPPGNPEYFEKAKAMGRALAGIWSDNNVTMYSNSVSDLGDNEEEKKQDSELMLGDRTERVNAVKARVDPDNVFTRSVLPATNK